MTIKGLSTGFTRVSLALVMALGLAACVDSDEAQHERDRAAAGDVIEKAQGDLSTVDPAEDGSRDARMAALDNQIRSMVGIARADSIEQCRLAEVGKRACGGPEYFIAYSTKVTDADALMQLVDEYTQLRVKQIEETGEMGTCEVLPQPVLELQNGVCRALPTKTM